MAHRVKGKAEERRTEPWQIRASEIGAVDRLSLHGVAFRGLSFVCPTVTPFKMPVPGREHLIGQPWLVGT